MRLYGIPDSAYSGDAEMFKLMHEMRVRIMTAPAFSGDKVIAAILFERTMDGEAQGQAGPDLPVGGPGRRSVPQGRQRTGSGKRRRQPDEADARISTPCWPGRSKLGVFGTKMRSVINLASKTGIAAIAKQQFEIGEQIAKHGLMPILEPEVSIKSPEKAGAEAILLDELTKGLDALPAGRQVMLKLTIPETPDFYGR